MRALVAAVALLAVAGCGSDGAHRPDRVHATAVDPSVPRTITVTSPAFEDGAAIPSTYTCQGKGDPPPLGWTPVDSEEVGSLALVVDDPDAPGGGYVHWVLLGIPTARGAIDADSIPQEATEVDASGGPGWTAPCPPSGTHHYRFTLYALPNDISAVSGEPSLEERLASLAKDATAWGRLAGTVTAK